MIELGFAKLKKHEGGFTLLEVLIALSIMSAIMGGISSAVFIITGTSSLSNESNVNLRQVQNAGYWISKDALMAQAVDTDKSGVFLSLSWSDWNGESNTVDYVLEGSTLMRQANGSSSNLIAEYLVPADTKCVWIGGENKLKVTIKASLHGDQGSYAERTYEISPRPLLKGN